jgi:hypothetical protein
MWRGMSSTSGWCYPQDWRLTPVVKYDGDADTMTRLLKAKRADGGSPAGSSGNKLMRGTIVGGLREKYHDVEPLRLCWPYPGTCNTSIPRVRKPRHAHGGIPKKPISTSSSISPGTPIVPAPSKSRPLPFSPPGPIHPHPCPTTRSFSPISLDIVLSKLFHCNHSVHPSTSFLAEDSNAPPLPKPPRFAQHIIDPSELGKVEEEGARSPTRIQPPRNISIPIQVWIMKIGQSFARLRSSYLRYPFPLFVALLST